jgi:ketosteroid isomerase-like protein
MKKVRRKVMSLTGRQLVVIVSAVVGFFAIALSGGRSAGNNAEEEAAIRKVIAALDAKGNAPDVSLPDAVFWSGAYKKPFIRSSEKAEPRGGEGSIGERVPGSQKTKTEPIRIVVADSHDLAYEYSKFTLEFDMKSGKHDRFEGGLLRVWQKQGGEWKQAAVFMRPYE